MNLNKYKNIFKDSKFKSENTKGRLHKEDDYDCFSDVINCYNLDVEKILSSKALRRLGGKTQVFSNPDNVNVRTRDTHTKEVVSLSRLIAEILGLNISLCEAIAYAHDIGHTPYGHLGEGFLSDKLKINFKHNEFGVVLAQYVERKNGLNLSYEVLEGVIHHSTGGKWTMDDSLPLEYRLVMFADKICYVFADISDAKRYGYIKHGEENDLIMFFGNTHTQRIHQTVHFLLEESYQQGTVSFNTTEAAKKFAELRNWCFENICHKIPTLIEQVSMEVVYNFLASEPSWSEYDPALLFAIMTDEEICRLVSLMSRSTILTKEHFKDVGFVEGLPYLKGKNVVAMINEVRKQFLKDKK